VQNFRNLVAWQKAHQLTLASYKATSLFPREELYGITRRIRRCCASIAANIAEGCGRQGNSELHRFPRIAAGSASELEYHFLLAKDLGLLSAHEHRQLDAAATELKRMLTVLCRKVNAERFKSLPKSAT